MMCTTGPMSKKKGAAATAAAASAGGRSKTKTSNGNGNANGGASRSRSNGHATKAQQQSKDAGASSASKPSFLRKAILRLLRITTLDLPLAALFVLLLGAHMLQYIYDNYLSVQLKNMAWTPKRKRREMTYYDRRCDETDMSTQDVADLLIPQNFTTEDCVHHMMVHGASMYPDVLTADTTIQLREFILRRNAQLSDDDAISVIENKQRWSFGIGANEDPIVPVALKEIATHRLLAPALNEIAGDDPAVIEMTAITSAYGAKDQFWHIDTVASNGNDLLYGRSFVPSYSLFIPLQDTTAAMGATETCPGTQVCHEGVAEDLCAEHGFQVSGDGPGDVWRRGYGVLQNQHTYHRGPAHTDPHGDHRVLFILTFAPRPSTRAESRMIGQSGSYSTRWDMWGHTLSDLADATTRMAPTWAVLRSLGLYKLPNANWGWDLPSVASMRIINEDTGYTLDDFEEFYEDGGIRWLPKLITENASDEGWMEYFVDCLDTSRRLLAKANAVALSVYIALAVLISTFQFFHRRRSNARNFRGQLCIGGVLKRLICTHGIIAASAYLMLRHIDETPWAKDIRYGRHMTSAFTDAENAKIDSNEDFARPSIPEKFDIMFGMRYDGENYGSINRFLDYHNGNIWYKSLIDVFAGSKDYIQAPLALRKQTVKTILSEIECEGRRVLVQNESGGWIEASATESQELTLRELLKADRKILSSLDANISLMLAAARYGYLRSTTMAQKYTADLLTHLRQELFSSVDKTEASKSSSTAMPQRKAFTYLFNVKATSLIRDREPKSFSGRNLAPIDRSPNMFSRICSSLECKPRLDEDNSMFFVGDTVEVKYQAKYNEWYKARIIGVNPMDGLYAVEYADEEMERNLPSFAVRDYIPPRVEEVFEARVPESDDVWELCAVVDVLDGERYNVEFQDGTKGRNLTPASIRRLEWEFEENDFVLVMTNKRRLKWERAIVTSDQGDRHYAVRYDNGEEDVDIRREDMHLRWNFKR